MTQVPIEELLKRCSSIYRLVILAAKRAKEVAEGAPSLIETSQRKITSIALEEILHGKVLYKPIAEKEGGKKGRGARTKETKKARAS